MGDADDLKEAGLNWGWDDNYPDFRERETRAEHWKKRNSKKRQWVAEDDLKSTAKDLIEIRKKIKDLKNQERALKNELLKKMPRFSWTEISDKSGDYIIERLKPNLRFRFDRGKAYSFMSSKAGSDFAAFVIEKCSYPSRGRDTIYVRPFPPSALDTAGVDPQNEQSDELKNSRYSETSNPDTSDDFDDDIPF